MTATWRTHPSPIGHDWKLVDGRRRPIRHTYSALPMHLPNAPVPSGQSDSDTESDSEEESDSHVSKKSLC